MVIFKCLALYFQYENMLGGKHVREENQLPHIVKKSQNLLLLVVWHLFCSFLVGSGHCRLCLTLTKAMEAQET